MGSTKPVSKVSAAVSYLFFPVMVVATPAMVYFLIEAEYSVPVATYLTVFFIAIAFFLGEKCLPHSRDWSRPHNDLLNDLLSGTIAYVLLPIFLKPLYTAMLAGITLWLASQMGSSLWPGDWPLALQLVLLLLLGDAGRYWGHRLAHELPFLWRFHAVHHSATRLWWWNATRQHPVDKAWFTFTEMFFPVLLGAEGVVLAMYFCVTAVCGFSQHCNIELKLGRLYWFFNVVELHRWHHSKNPTESDNNYGNNLIIYDRLFGTYFHPERQGQPDKVVGDIGLINPDYPQNYLGQLIAPFHKGLDKQVQGESAVRS